MSEARRPPGGRLVVRIPCSVCGRTAASVELVPHGHRPARWWRSPAPDRRRWRFLFSGIDGGNGSGDEITADEAARLADAFSPPLTYDKVRQADLYDDAGFCAECRKPYCHAHWNVSVGGYGRGPEGHGRSLDPHWSPDDYD